MKLFVKGCTAPMYSQLRRGFIVIKFASRLKIWIFNLLHIYWKISLMGDWGPNWQP